MNRPEGRSVRLGGTPDANDRRCESFFARLCGREKAHEHRILKTRLLFSGQFSRNKIASLNSDRNDLATMHLRCATRIRRLCTTNELTRHLVHRFERNSAEKLHPTYRNHFQPIDRLSTPATLPRSYRGGREQIENHARSGKVAHNGRGGGSARLLSCPVLDHLTIRFAHSCLTCHFRFSLKSKVIGDHLDRVKPSDAYNSLIP
ncbi:hypothetical protein [Caudoviricetes sp.]|nr:hypothetical protein [Caudoviricetes sp.]